MSHPNSQAKLDYFVADVFTDTPLKGNPLAVVMNTCDLKTEQMQAIAREFNLSETTFVERRLAGIERVEGVRVRIFTTQEELPFAGHPTLGTANGNSSCVVKIRTRTPSTRESPASLRSTNVVSDKLKMRAQSPTVLLGLQIARVRGPSRGFPLSGVSVKS